MKLEDIAPRMVCFWRICSEFAQCRFIDLSPGIDWDNLRAAIPSFLTITAWRFSVTPEGWIWSWHFSTELAWMIIQVASFFFPLVHSFSPFHSRVPNPSNQLCHSCHFVASCPEVVPFTYSIHNGIIAGRPETSGADDQFACRQPWKTTDGGLLGKWWKKYLSSMLGKFWAWPTNWGDVLTTYFTTYLPSAPPETSEALRCWTKAAWFPTILWQMDRSFPT